MYFPRVKEETNTRIDLPSEAADSDLIVITGKKADVDLARKKLLAIQAELEGTSPHFLASHITYFPVQNKVYFKQITSGPRLHVTH